LKESIDNRKSEDKKSKYVCYTLDLEEDHAGYLRGHYEGLKYLEDFIQIIKENEISVSFFVQAKLIDFFPEKIQMIRDSNFEIHLHSYSHSLRKNEHLNSVYEDIKKSRETYQEFFNNDPKGYRFPLGVLEEYEYRILKEFNFKFDSSIFPTFRPNYFNNFTKPLTPYKINNIIEIPFSVISKTIRIPISLSYIKLFYPLHFIAYYDIPLLIFDFLYLSFFNTSKQ